MSHPFHHLQFGPGSIILDDGKRVETTCSHSLGPDCVSLTQPSDFSLNMHDEDMLIDVIMFSIQVIHYIHLSNATTYSSNRITNL